MSLPTPDNDYAAPSSMALTKASWDAAMTSIGRRLRAREALEASFQALINLGVGQAIAAVQNEIGPTAAQAQADATAIAALLDALVNDGVPTAMIETSPAARFVSDAEMDAKASASAVANLVTAIALLAPRTSPNFLGAPTAPTPAGGDNSAKLATTAFVKTAIAALVASAPGTLDTLDELAAALGDDANFASTVTSALAARLRFDAAQALSADEKTQARTNLGLGSLATQSAVNPADLPAGAWVHLTTLTASNSAALQALSIFSSDYDEYEIVFEDIAPVADGVNFDMQLRSGGVFQSSYSSNVLNQTTAGINARASTTEISCSGVANDLDNATNHALNGWIRLNNPAGVVKHKYVYGHITHASNSNGTTISRALVSAVWWGGTGAITGAQWFMSSGNIASGKIHIFGRKK